MPYNAPADEYRFILDHVVAFHEVAEGEVEALCKGLEDLEHAFLDAESSLDTFDSLHGNNVT